MSISVSTLGAEATIIMGQSPPGESYNRERKGVPLLNGPSEFGSVHPVEVQWTTSPTKLCQGGDVLFCVRGATAGRLNTADKEYCIGRGLAAIRAKPGKFDSGFLRYVLANGYARFQSRGVGSTFINISADELAEFPVPALPLSEQRRIAEILDKADVLRAKRSTALAQVDALTQSIFLEVFGDPVANPKRWPNPSVGDVLTFQQYGPRFYNESYSIDGVRIVRITDLSEAGVLDFDSMPRLAVSAEDREKYLLRPGDLLFARSGATVGKTALIQSGSPPCIAGAYFITMRFDRRIDPRYARAVLASPSVRSIVAKRSRQAAQQNFSGPGLRGLPMPCPPIELQHEFARRSEAVDRMKNTQSASLAALDALFVSMQQSALGAVA